MLRAGGPQGGGGVTAAKGLGHQVGAGTREGTALARMLPEEAGRGEILLHLPFPPPSRLPPLPPLAEPNAGLIPLK